MMKRTLVGLAASLFLLGAAASLCRAGFEPGLTLTSYDTLATNPNYSAGYEFRSDQAITVNALAYFDSGSGLTQGHGVGLWDVNGNLLASTTVTNGDLLIGNFRYHSIADVQLTAGQDYVVGGVFGNDPFAARAQGVFDSRISYVRNRFVFTGDSVTLAFPSGHGPAIDDLAYFGGSIGIATPEPSSLALFGIATATLVGYFGWQRRKRPVPA